MTHWLEATRRTPHSLSEMVGCASFLSSWSSLVASPASLGHTALGSCFGDEHTQAHVSALPKHTWTTTLHGATKPDEYLKTSAA